MGYVLKKSDAEKRYVVASLHDSCKYHLPMKGETKNTE
jgi:hypothetical protein